ncbi:MAG: hypothetical protein E7655_00495 [Ruminococcaceae bacterium]|nr:hypothetical protein [Oscillospiraceae bacterium]
MPMKTFSRSLLIALLAVVLAVPFALSASAEEAPVIFIKDGGKGDGSSADSPLSTVEYYIDQTVASTSLHFKSALYQAAHRLQYSGGTIVICGEILLDENNVQGNSNTTEDFFMPDHPDSHITITSVYNGVDYRKSGARLILKTPAEFMSGGPLTFRDINICTMGTDRIVAGSGYDLIMDDGVACIPLDDNKNIIPSPATNRYPVLVGGHRYKNLQRREGDYTLTVNSGTYQRINAASYGFGSGSNDSYGRIYGNANLIINGTTKVLGDVCGASHREVSFLAGDSTITINGGSIGGKIYATGKGGFGVPNATFTLKINTSSISPSALEGKAASLSPSTDTVKHCNPAESILDLSDCSSATAAALAAKAKDFTQIILPAAKSAKASDVTFPAKTQYFVGETYDPAGLRFTLTSGTVKSVIDYTADNSHFQFYPAIDQPLTAGSKSIDVYYGSTYVGRSRITVSNAPSLDIMGAQIRTNSERQTLRFVGCLGDDVNGVTVKSYGIVVQPTEFFSEKSLDMPGATVINATGTSLTKMAGNLYFAGDVTNIPVEEYDRAFTAFAYMTVSYNGSDYTVYSDTIERSVRGVAEAACADASKEPAEKKTQLTENVLSATVSTPDQTLIDSKVEQMLENMRTMGSVKWLCNADMDFKDDSQFTGSLQYTKGVTYTGVPYIAGSNGNISLAQWLSICPDGGSFNGPTGWNTMPGNQCSSSVVRAMQSVTNTHKYFYGYSINYSLPKATHPYYDAVGGYTVHPCTMLTQEVVEQQGSTNAERFNAIYEAYTHAKKGDFMVSTWIHSAGNTLGHIRIVDSVHVVYKDGKIDPAASYMLLTEQQSSMDKTNHTTWRFEKKYKFNQLCSTSTSAKYIPIRLKDFTTGYFETPYMTVRERNTPDNIANGLSGKIYSNYQIHEVRVTITDSTGKEVIKLQDFPFTIMYYDIRCLDLNGTVAKLPAGSYHYELEVAYAEEKPTCVSFDFTK